MKGRFISLLLSIAVAITAGMTAHAAQQFDDETLKYVITYKWGLVTKDTGDATLSLRRQGDAYNITLTGRTRSWADRFYTVRDTLRSIVGIDGLKPRQYIKIANEGGTYSRDHITYAYPGGNSVEAGCNRFKRKKDGSESTRDKSLSATGPTYDMLSVFYYLRVLPYSELTGRKAVVLTMFSGMAAETVTIKCLGKETVKLRNGKKREAWHISFRFTTDGRKKSSDDINAWISADNNRIPLKIEGSLPLGKVSCHYLGS